MGSPILTEADADGVEDESVGQVAMGEFTVRIHSHDQLLGLLDEVVARSSRGDRTSEEAAGFWTELLTREGHPLATNLPDENLLDWHERGLLGHLDDARVLDVGCGNGRNSRWFAEQGALVAGVDLAASLLDLVRSRMPTGVTLTRADVLRSPLPAGPFDVVYDSGCFHHLAPHRRRTYLERVLPHIAEGGLLGIVTFASEAEELTSDAEVLTSGDTGGGSSFSLPELREIFSALDPIAGRRLRAHVKEAFGADFLNAALFAQRA